MPPLPTQLRNRLESAVKQARRTAEAAARVAIERLTVANPEPGGHLTVEERTLRNRLRAHGRQLGDQRDLRTGSQAISRLVQECAYEHWHRMLFARFLAENHLLIHAREGMAVSLAECEELAADEGAPDGWTLAARYAARMLPQIFRPSDPVLQIGFAPEHKRALEKLVTELPAEVFTAEDSLGWVYQFWQAERKDEVNASGDKITGETLPAVTQLFTEHYMVQFLLHNTIGAWWAARLRAEGNIKNEEWLNCETEEDCRKVVALPGYELDYLRFVRDENDGWVPAAGGFTGWPKSLRDFKLLDPCCGSGHFLVAAFALLARMRMHDENLSPNEACDAVLSENLHGLELDARCTQIAAFALALAAWKFTGGFRPLPPLNIACSGLGVNAKKEEWLALANGDTRLQAGLEQLYDLFQKAPELGSLINPRQLAQGDLVRASFAEIQPLLAKALESERAKKDDDLNELAVAAQGMATSAELLGSGFNLVITNVPFLGRGNQSEALQNFSKNFDDDAKADLASTFIIRCLAFCATGQTVALVTPQNWLFLASYCRVRDRLLRTLTWDLVARLGPGAFETIGGEVVNVALFSFSREPAPQNHRFLGCDATNLNTVPEKAEALNRAKCFYPQQSVQLLNPDARILFEETGKGALLCEYASSFLGLGTGDYSRFGRCFWELDPILAEWSFQQGSVMETLPYGGREHLVFWDFGISRIRGMTDSERDNIHNQDQSGKQAWGRTGVAVSLMRELRATLYTGEIFDKALAVLVPKDPNHVNAIWAFSRSNEFGDAVRLLDQKTIVANGTLTKVRFDLEKWQRIADEDGPLPTPVSSDPTQWLFNGSMIDSTAPLHVATARLLGYQWPRQTGSSFPDCPSLGPDGLEQMADEDGIVCIPSVRGEAPAAERLRALLAAAYGSAWSPGKLDELLSTVDHAGATLEDWLRNGFFEQHYKLFHHRPFLWQIWDGRKDGFSALVNYHKLDHKLLEKLTYTYLGEWIKRQQESVARAVGGADDRLVKAQHLQEKLKLVLEGEAPYDIFVRWKELALQPMGWNPDLNDGVRLNIRPFMVADVLRKRPNIKWGVDRGKNPPGSPWGEVRDNDRHLTLAEKRAKCPAY